MGLIERLFGKRRGQQSVNPATNASGPMPTRASASTKERSVAPNPPARPAEPEYTQEELFDKLRNEYAFGIREGEKYVPQFDDLDMLYELKNFARHPRVQYLAGERYKEVLRSVKRKQGRRSRRFRARQSSLRLRRMRLPTRCYAKPRQRL